VASPIPTRSGPSSWMYECMNCGHQIDVELIQAMPTCPNCNGPRVWTFRSDAHSEDDDPGD
jgi:DNA-directed RNA polymerase subunit RPC12/RpoP